MARSLPGDRDGAHENAPISARQTGAFGVLTNQIGSVDQLKVHRFWTFALGVGQRLEIDLLSFAQGRHARPFDR